MRKLPEWLETAVFYEIYPQSFLDTNGDGIGDLNGIIEKLDYIRELGCNALWLNPCFDSPFGDAGYDVADYCRIAPRYGTNADAQRLFNEAHARGMHVILDLVPGHTSLEHPWFKASCRPEHNALSARYIWTDSVWNSPAVANISGWLRGICDRDGACGVNFFSNQPALNYGFYRRDAAWQQDMDDPAPLATGKAMEDVVRFWLDMGCDGFRVDMASSLIKNDPEHIGIVKFWNRFFDHLRDDYPEAAFVAEWGDPLYSLQAGFDMDFLLQFGPSHYMDLFRTAPYFSADAAGDMTEFVRVYNENLEKTGGRGLMCIPTGNHDMIRLSHTLTDAQQRLAFAFILSMPGAPFIYYGDEIGMRYLEGLTSVEGGYFRTGSRSPMQWNATKKAGFSTAELTDFYIRLDDAQDRPNVADAMADRRSLWWQVHDLIALRQSHRALGVLGEVRFLVTGTADTPLVYLRSDGMEQILVAINPSRKERSVRLAMPEGRKIYGIGTSGGGLSGGILTAPAGSACFYLLPEA